MTSEVPQHKHASSLSSDTSRRRLITGQRLPWPTAVAIIGLIALASWAAIIWIVLRLTGIGI